MVREPARTGAVVPSSRFLTEAMMQDVDWPSVRTVVELGPGTGVFTEAIQNRIDGHARFLSVELDALFASRLRERFPELTVIEGSAEWLRDHLDAVDAGPADCIVGGLPWANFPVRHQLRMLENVADALRPRGLFSTFAYIHGPLLPSGRRFRRMLRRTFSHLEISPLVWRNLPPAWVYRCRK
jgi:phospholipid N-methyltransferase